MYRKLNYISLILISSLFLLISCDGTRIYEVNKEINNADWEKDLVQEFDFEINDTELYYNVIINIRNKNNYAYSNLYLFIEMSSPLEKFFTDTLEFQLADQKGKWTGSGVGNLWQNQVSLLSNVKMLEQGNYKINISQGMRDKNLIGISDVGVRVEQSK